MPALKRASCWKPASNNDNDVENLKRTKAPPATNVLLSDDYVEEPDLLLAQGFTPSNFRMEDSPFGGPDLISVVSVLWGNFSNREHKIWNGDAIMAVRWRLVVLKELNGDLIARGGAFSA